MTQEARDQALRGVAQNPEAFAAYLADTQRVLLEIGANLEVLRRETRVHCRGTHVEGDRWYHARMRALPVEKALRDALRHVKALTEGLERSTHKRRAHEEQVRALPVQRQEKALAKARKKNPPLQLRTTPQAEPNQTGPTSIYDLRRERSA